MATVEINIPQIGEGLQEARLVAVLKKPGDKVARDEPIYQMETDKAVMDVESPYSGVLTAWLAEVDAILPIGAAVATMEIEGEAASTTSAAPAETAAPAATPDSSGARGLNIPPRTRAYAKEKGVSDSQLAELAASGAKLMPADIDAFLAGGTSKKGYTEQPIPSKQRLLASRLQRGHELVVPGTMSVPIKWGAIEAARHKVKASGSDFQPSAFTMFAFAAVQALKEYPAFRTQLQGDSTLRTYDHVALGIAVGLPGDELVIAVVEDADTLTWKEFAAKAREKIDLARTGKDQVTEAVTVSLTNMQSFGLRDAIPVVVSPAVATVFLGAVYNGFDDAAHEPTVTRLANIAITFDHRLINGVGAAHFMNAIKSKVEDIASLVESGD